ncbi:uncharacterized protein MELLADRAFT_60532 [Melampsora larici-populina 98AG31]|uniref:Uncharacterized protein n=1 Tax=Melampsora larici-populina (strain 98AG31 / pathotype 3-4-7) TaxID=747676 RepID=F4RBI9_MELLP|nr:uncharacterized protein MELLADRAFT_60532 [Melampsora larici-populina 98AG31]EGG10093.1 hypothetical protein MELLADRAFT_60532 [Melampsora larici-populina 98AG31]
MLPPFLPDDVSGLMPELRELAVHHRRPESLLSRGNPDDRASDFRIFVQGTLKRYQMFHIKDAVATHIEKYKFLNTLELGAIEHAAYMVEDVLLNIVAKVHDTEKVMSYCKMLLRSTDPDVIRHRNLYKRQIEESQEQHKIMKETQKRYYKDAANLWALLSEETMRLPLGACQNPPKTSLMQLDRQNSDSGDFGDETAQKIETIFFGILLTEYHKALVKKATLTSMVLSSLSLNEKNRYKQDGNSMDSNTPCLPKIRSKI